KPVLGHGAVPVRSAKDVATLVDRDGPLLVQPFLAGPLHAVAGVMWAGRLVAAVHQRFDRIWPRDCGMASAAVTVQADVALEQGLASLLGTWDGVFQADLAAGALLDVNPRLYASLPLAVASGVNLPALFCDLAMGRRDGDTLAAGSPMRARPGVRFRWLDGDVRSVLGGVRHGSMRVSQAMAAMRP